MPRKLSTQRARRFCQALERAAAGRQIQWWTAIDTVARELGIPVGEAIVLADDCAAAGLVVHDQSQHTKAGRRAAELPHSVSLKGAGWALARSSGRRPPRR